MRKTTKKTTRKKNLSVKSNTQHVRNIHGELFILKNGKLAQGRTGWRSVRLSDIRESLASGFDVTVTTKLEGAAAYTDNFTVSQGYYNEGDLRIGCQVFDGQNAAKILKRAKVTV